jgi:hypothetical protein
MPIPPVGTLYNPSLNGIQWSQPVPGSPVFPQQQINVPYGAPAIALFMIEASGLFVAGCGHWCDAPRVFIDSGLAVICCPLCSFIQYTMPEAQFYSTFQTPLTII